MGKIWYPQAPRGDTVEVLHGVPIADPYRWLEEIDSADTRAWIEAQNRITSEYLGRIPARDPIRQRLTELWNYERWGVPAKRGGRYFYTRNDGLQDQSVLYWTASLDAEPWILLDPNVLSEDGTIALTDYAVSDDGRLLAYGLSTSGSDWQEWYVREVDTGRDREDHLRWVKFSGASWAPDASGFFYSRYDEPREGIEYKGANYYQKLCFHRIGTAQADDSTVYERPDQKEWGFGGEVTEDGRYLVIAVWRGTHRENDVFYQELGNKGAPVIELITGFEASYVFVGNDGPVFYFTTDLDAPRSRMIAVDVRQPDRANWREIIPEAADALQWVDLAGGRFVVHYLHDAHSRLAVVDRDGAAVREVELPGIGTVAGFAGRQDDPESFVLFTGFTLPGTILRYDVETGEGGVFRQPELAFDPDDYVTSQVTPAGTAPASPCLSAIEGDGSRMGRRRPTSTGTGVLTSPARPSSPRRTWYGWRWAGSLPRPTCAVAASMARPGTR
jgi:prolyl oligopeptidase